MIDFWVCSFCSCFSLFFDSISFLQIGQGTYSSVYKARDVTHNKLVALKRVRFDNTDVESVKFMAREILILRRLNHPNIIKLEGLVTSSTSSSLHLVFEYMEHDLTGLASRPEIKFTEPQVKCYMKQLLSGLDHCHSHGVLHRDIKGPNLLLDNNGVLKISDFGLATFFDRNRDIPLTSRVVTLWYRPLELLLGASHYGAAVDLWSAGCILGELYNGQPIMPGRTEVEQIHKIFKLCGSPSEDYWMKAKIPKDFKPSLPYKCRLAEAFRDFPAPAVRLMEVLLSIDPAQRGSAAMALRSEYFKTEPFACDPSSLPKYPPSKEFDAKLRDEDAKRRAALRVEGHKVDSETRGLKDMRDAPVVPADAYITSTMQRRHGHPNPRSRSGILKPHSDEAAVDPPRLLKDAKETSKPMVEHPHQRTTSFSGPLGPGGWSVSGKKYEDVTFVSRNNLSTLSGLVATRTLASEDSREKLSRDKLRPSYTVKENHFQESLKSSGESVVKQDQRHRIQNVSSSRYTETEKATKGPVAYGHPSKGSKIHFSGPLGVPPNKVDQMLKEHDRQIQEAARRTRLDKTRINRNDVQHMQTTTNALYTSSYKAR
ncbi:OLC1v1023959C1 [Oldenlandia corymbosa var. corymbosa]|uniref:OLC1v1023959C1 n=1 Tax=Oldenlandia corymbosa var. corymbosa TaxID=529605 RepID=A0AAV1C2U5_OLDCO|nr:OLC1v1023959C1 [Oldenlandia corymbosa var. corymbosa]